MGPEGGQGEENPDKNMQMVKFCSIKHRQQVGLFQKIFRLKM